jgi:ATP-dependent RNA helicase RhlB
VPKPAPVAAEGERPARKRRRRRGGQRLENGEAIAQAPASVAASATPGSQSAQPSLLSRIGRGLKSLVTRSPSKQH